MSSASVCLASPPYSTPLIATSDKMSSWLGAFGTARIWFLYYLQSPRSFSAKTSSHSFATLPTVLLRPTRYHFESTFFTLYSAQLSHPIEHPSDDHHINADDTASTYSSSQTIFLLLLREVTLVVHQISRKNSSF